MAKARGDFTDILVKRGQIAVEQIDEALNMQRQTGAKNVQGAVLYSKMLHEIVPEFWKMPDAPIERPIVEQKTCITTEDSYVTIGYKSLKFLEGIPNCYTIIRVHFDQWYAKQAEAAGAEVFCGVMVREVLKSVTTYSA